MNSLVTIHDGTPVTSTHIVAENTDIEHASVIVLVRKYQSDFEEFGGVRFQIVPFETAGGKQQRQVALLNQEQANLLGTYMRNTEKVRRFKIELVRAFAEATAAPALATPKSLPEALRLAADAIEKKELAEQQRDQLAIELDQHSDYASVKFVEGRKHMHCDWRLLKMASEKEAIKIGKVFDQNYGTVNTYHADVWRKVYSVDIKELRK